MNSLLFGFCKSFDRAPEILKLVLDVIILTSNEAFLVRHLEEDYKNVEKLIFPLTCFGATHFLSGTTLKRCICFFGGWGGGGWVKTGSDRSNERSYAALHYRSNISFFPAIEPRSNSGADL